MRFVVVMLAHGMLRRLDRDRRGLHGDEAHGPNGRAPGARAKGSMAKAGYFVSRWKGAARAAGK